MIGDLDVFITVSSSFLRLLKAFPSSPRKFKIRKGREGLKHISKVRVLLIGQVPEGVRVPAGLVQREGVPAFVLPRQEQVQGSG